MRLQACFECGSEFAYGDQIQNRRYVTRAAWLWQIAGPASLIANLLIEAILWLFNVSWRVSTIRGCMWLTVPALLLFTPLLVAHPLARETLRMNARGPATMGSVIVAMVMYGMVLFLQAFVMLGLFAVTLGILMILAGEL